MKRNKRQAVIVRCSPCLYLIYYFVFEIVVRGRDGLVAGRDERCPCLSLIHFFKNEIVKSIKMQAGMRGLPASLLLTYYFVFKIVKCPCLSLDQYFENKILIKSNKRQKWIERCPCLSLTYYFIFEIVTKSNKREAGMRDVPASLFFTISFSKQ